MKISIRQNYQHISFNAGLTPRLLKEIQQADILDISGKLAKKGVPNDFRDSKIIAWCSDKAIQILQQINERFGQKLSLPKGVYVEDFRNLRTESPSALGTCNLLPTKLKKGSDEIVPSRTIFFNSIHNWDSIDSISDNQYAARHFSTDFFLYPFFHEFAHAIHEDRLLNKFGGKKLVKILKKLNEGEQLKKYRDVYGSSVRQICNYAQNTPLDAVACDMARVISEALDKDTLIPTKNPFIGTAYDKLSFWQRLNIPKHPTKEKPLKEILRDFWDGKFV